MVLAAFAGVVASPVSAKHRHQKKRVVSLSAVGTRLGKPTLIRVHRNLPRGAKAHGYTIRFGDKTRARGKGLPRRLRHTYAAPGRYRVKLTFGYGRNRHAKASLRLRIRAVPVQRWFTIDGAVVAVSDDAILSLGGADPTYTLIGTRAGSPITIDPRLGLPPGTEISANETGIFEEATLTPPVPGHPQGVAIVAMDTQTQPQGINPATFGFNYAVFDAGTGQHVLTSATAPRGPNILRPLTYLEGSVGVGGSAYEVISPSGQVTEFPWPGSEPYVLSPVVNGRVLVEATEGSEGQCPVIWVYDLASKAPVSTSPCLRRSPSLTFGGSIFNGNAYASRDDPFVYSAASGAALTTKDEFGPYEGYEEGLGIKYMEGARSDLILAYPPSYGEGPSYFVSTATWQPVFTVPEASWFEPFGIADDYVWLEGASGKIVIDGRTGIQVASNWTVAPVNGGSGWTLTSTDPIRCCGSQAYLLRSTGTLLENLSTAPTNAP